MGDPSSSAQSTAAACAAERRRIGPPVTRQHQLARRLVGEQHRKEGGGLGRQPAGLWLARPMQHVDAFGVHGDTGTVAARRKAGAVRRFSCGRRRQHRAHPVAPNIGGGWRRAGSAGGGGKAAAPHPPANVRGVLHVGQVPQPPHLVGPQRVVRDAGDGVHMDAPPTDRGTVIA